IARLILKIVKPTSGSILFKGKNIWSIDDREYYRKIQGVFQDPFSSFNPRRKVLETFHDVLKNYYNIKDSTSKNVDSDENFIAPALELVGINIDDVNNRYPHEFSGGQLQRLSIARALLVKPELIVADEPVSMIDASTRIDILNIFIDLKEKENLSSIIIGHDLSLMSYVSDRVLVLYRGQIVEEGPVDVLADPAHPYTKMLAESVPRIDSKWSQSIKFNIEEHTGLNISGCIFAHRCPFRKEICLHRDPPYINLGKSRVKCWLYASK
ncbi:MAG: ABC transporter ATP-binding protein, partial [Desulfurococcaceae archaeon]